MPRMHVYLMCSPRARSSVNLPTPELRFFFSLLASKVHASSQGPEERHEDRYDIIDSGPVCSGEGSGEGEYETWTQKQGRMEEGMASPARPRKPLPCVPSVPADWFDVGIEERNGRLVADLRMG